MLEYRLVPLMVSVVKIGDELSAAALTRGLGAPVKRTKRVPDRFPCSRFDCDSVLRYLFCLVFVSAADFFLTGGG